MERKPIRYLWIAFVIVGLAIAYPVSIGPAEFLSNYFDFGPLNQPVMDALDLFYSPLFLLPEPMRTWIGDWANYWTDLVPVRVVGGDA